MEPHSTFRQTSIRGQKEDMFGEGTDTPVFKRGILLENIPGFEDFDRMTGAKSLFHPGWSDREWRPLLFIGVMIEGDQENGGVGGETQEMVAIAVPHERRKRDQGSPVVDPGRRLELIGPGGKKIPFDEPDPVALKDAMGAILNHRRNEVRLLPEGLNRQWAELYPGDRMTAIPKIMKIA